VTHTIHSTTSISRSLGPPTWHTGYTTRGPSVGHSDLLRNSQHTQYTPFHTIHTLLTCLNDSLARSHNWLTSVHRQLEVVLSRAIHLEFLHLESHHVKKACFLNSVLSVKWSCY